MADESVAVPPDQLAKEMEDDERLLQFREEYNRKAGLNVGVVRGVGRGPNFVTGMTGEDNYAEALKERLVSPHKDYPVGIVEGPAARARSARLQQEGVHVEGAVTVDPVMRDVPTLVESGHHVPGAVMVPETAAAETPTPSPKTKTAAAKEADVYAPPPPSPAAKA